METFNKLIKIVVTKDGSHSIYRTDIDEHYHSVNGAIQESMHVFINAGLLDHINANKNQQINILEIGFGTGLNAFLTLLETQKSSIDPIINYHTLEPFPLEEKWVEQLNYPNSVNDKKAFLKLHKADWEIKTKINGQLNSSILISPALKKCTIVFCNNLNLCALNGMGRFEAIDEKVCGIRPLKNLHGRIRNRKPLCRAIFPSRSTQLR